MNDIDTTRIKEDLISLNTSLSTSVEEELFKEVESGIQSDAISVLVQANDKLLLKYEELKKLIQKYIDVLNFIERYQSLDSELDRINADIEWEENREEPDYSYIRSLKSDRSSIVDEMIDLKRDIYQSI